MLRKRMLLPALLTGSLLVACDTDEEEEKEKKAAQLEELLQEQGLGSLARQALREEFLESETRVPTGRGPSVRRLLGSLPAALPGRESRWSSTEDNPEDGEWRAVTRYRKGPQDPMPLSLEVAYLGPDRVARMKRRYERREGVKDEIAGLDALLVDPDRGNREVILWVAENLLVRADGSMKMSLLKEAVEAIDLAGLKKQLDSQELFEPCRNDRIADSILSRADLEELAPESIGPASVLSCRSERSVEDDKMQARVEVHSPIGFLKIFDLGTPDRLSLGAPMDFSDHTEFELMQDSHTCERSEYDRDGAQVSQFLATANRQGGSKHVTIFLRAQFGRFLVDYSGQWSSAPDIEADTPGAEQMREALRQSGIGLWESHEEQIEAILGALSWDAMKTWNDKIVQ